MSAYRRLVLSAALIAVALGASNCSTGDDAQDSASITRPTGATLVAPEAFARRVDAPGVVTINVHVPDEGTIAGTDLTIPFDQIAGSRILPTDRATPLAVYCRSGNMSADAVRDLETMGYTDIVELDGGFNAWASAGRPLDTPR